MRSNFKPEKINVTRDYSLFQRDPEQKMHNREVEVEKHRRLRESMKKYGWLPCYPMIAWRDDKGRLWVKDGQHRLAIARELSLPCYWVEAKQNFNVAEVNSTSVIWKIIDYVKLYAAHGNPHYQRALDFASGRNLPVGVACTLLTGTSRSSEVNKRIMGGEFEIKNEEYAEKVADVYNGLIALAPVIRNSRLLEACASVCHDPAFFPKRLLETAQMCREKLVPYSTRDAYLVMMEEVYNYRKQRLYPLRINALKIAKDKWEKWENPLKAKETHDA